MTDAERLQQALAQAEQASQQFQEQLRATEARLRTDPRCRAFFAPYPPEQQEAFIAHYLQRKAHYLTKGPNLLKYRLHQAIEYQEDAYERLFDIQQKKLFDLQVQWRAREIDLPGIRVHQQFNHWENNIHRCPFLPPITPQEYALYREYLATAAQDVGHDIEHGRSADWQGYEHLRDRWQAIHSGHPNPEQEGEDYPDWYAYVDRHLQRPAGYPFATHPDLRGERQKYYLKLAREEKQAQRAPNPPELPLTPPDPRPAYDAILAKDHQYDRLNDDPDHYLSDEDGPYDGRFTEFTRRFHPAADHIFALRRAMRRQYSTHYNAIHERIEQSIALLTDTDDRIPIEAHPDWRAAVTAAAAHQHRRLLLKALPTVWADYEFRIATGLQPAEPDQYRAYHDDDRAYNPHPPEKDETIAPYLEKGILRGRELAGEPRDWDF